MAFTLKNPFRSALPAPETKASRTAQLIALQSSGRARWTPRDYAALTREGYLKNAVVHRAVRLVAENAASVSWLLYDGAAEHDTHPLLDLIARPNPRQDGAVFLESVFAHLQLAGNAYVEAVTLDGAVRELYTLRPDRMRVVPGADGWPESYDYQVAGRSVRFEQTRDVPPNIPPILHLTHFHPLDDHYGLSPLEAAAVAVDALVMLAVDDRDLSSPPGAPAEGSRYLVKPAGSGAFAGKDNQIAHFRDGAFTFYAPQPGWIAYVIDEGVTLVFDGSNWMPLLGAAPQLQNVSRLGLAATADASNPLSVRLNNALFVAKAVADGGNGDLRYKLSKESAANTLSFLFQNNFSGRAEIGLTGDDDFHFKVSGDGSTWRDGIVVAAGTGRVSFPQGAVGVREKLTAARIYYVRPDGNDANDGFANSAGSAFLTIQKAIDTVFGGLDLDAFNVTIQLGDGIYTSGGNAGTQRLGTGSVTVQGNAAQPGNVIVNTSSVGCFRAAAGASLIIKDMELRTAGGINCLVATVGGFIQFGNVRFGSCGASHLRSEIGGLVEAISNYTIVGSAASAHVSVGLCGVARVSARTVTLTGSPAFSPFVLGTTAGMAVLSGNTFSGAATGKRYDVTLNAGVNVTGAGVNYLPGDVAGTTATGGQYG